MLEILKRDILRYSRIGKIKSDGIYKKACNHFQEKLSKKIINEQGIK